ncbi:MAG: PP2C family protein-serine/threonine phosphatase, partial [Mycobacteriales bacterium]
MTQRPVSFGLRYAVRSDVGLGRNDNQDSAFGGAHLLAVADGMGGAVGGAVASSAAISAIEAYDDLPDDADLTEVLQTAVEAANHEIAEVIDRQPDLRGMGTTLTALLSDGEHLALGHVGDSRAYRAAADGTVGQISHDHSFVQALVDEGRITAEEALTHPWRSRILRALMGSEVAIDVDLLDVSIGDRYLICSDGLTDYVRAETVMEAMREGTPDAAAERLVALALRGGGGDNITVIVADIVAAAEEAPPAEPVLAGAIAGESESPVEPTSPAARAAITLPIKQRRPAPAPAHRSASDGSATDDDAVDSDSDAAAPDDRAAHAHAAHADVAEDTATPAGADEDTGPDTAELARATDDRNAEAAGKRTDAAEHPPGRAGRRVGRYLALAAVIVLIAAGFGSYRWTKTQYVVRADDGTSMLDHGLNVSVRRMHPY